MADRVLSNKATKNEVKFMYKTMQEIQDQEPVIEEILNRPGKRVRKRRLMVGVALFLLALSLFLLAYALIQR